MPNAIPAGGAPQETSPHERNCFEIAASAGHDSPEAFTAHLVGVIADRMVVKPEFVGGVLAAANYTELIGAVKFGTAPAPAQKPRKPRKPKTAPAPAQKPRKPRKPKTA